MNNLQHYYEILGISSDASIAEIKEAYKDLIQIWHPDRYCHNERLQQKAEAKLKAINLAYEQLMKHLNFEPVEPQKKDVSPEETSKDTSVIEKFVQGLFKLTLLEQNELEKKINKFSDVSSWKLERLAAVGTIGGLTGAIGGPIGMAAIPAELLMCERSASVGSFGIGHLLGCDVDYDFDREIILAIWTNEGTLEKRVDKGKIGIKINEKKPSKSRVNNIMGIVVTKTILKGSSKFLGKLSVKLATKAVAKISAKLAAKS